MALILPSRFYRQPTTTLIDQGNPISRGLNAGYLASTKSFFGTASSAQATPNNTYRYDSRFGVGTLGSIGATALATVRQPIGANSDATLLSVFIPTNNINEYFPGNIGQTTGAMSFGISTGNASAAVIRGRMYLSGTRYFGGGTTITDFNKPIVAVVRQKFNIEQALFVNGVKDPTTSAFTGGSFAAGFIGVASAGSGQAQFLIATWGRALSDAEIWELSQDPYQIFHRPNRRIWVDVVGSSPDVTLSISGQSVAVTRGTLTPSTSVAETGLSIEVAQGAVIAGTTVAETGLSISTAQGSVAPALSVTETGQSIALSQGTVTANAGGDVTVAASGQSIATAQGTLTPATDKDATGQAITAAQGIGTEELAIALSGQSVGAAQGNVVYVGDVSVSLIGQPISVAQGGVSVPNTGSDTANRPGDRRSNWLWRFRDEEPEEVKIEEIKEVLVKKLKKVQKKAPDRNPAKQIATLAGRTVEQVESITVERIAQSVLPAISESLAENQLSIGDVLQDQAILYALIRSHVAKVDQDERLRLFLQDDEDAAEILLLM